MGHHLFVRGGAVARTVTASAARSTVMARTRRSRGSVDSVADEGYEDPGGASRLNAPLAGSSRSPLTSTTGDRMPNLGFSEIIILAIIAVPVLAVVAVPAVFAIVLWKRQAELRTRIERLEASLR